MHPRGILERLADRLRGREQRLVRAGDDLPLLLLSFPSGAGGAARDVELAYTHTLPRLGAETTEPYREVLARAPAMVVVLLQARNPCGCLGHHHPRGAVSRLTRRLEADLGREVGEIDLAYEGVREWEPEPLSSLAAGELSGRLPAIHFQSAALAVLLHELEHLVFPERPERDIRVRSNAFYTSAMRQLVGEESGALYGMASWPPPRP